MNNFIETNVPIVNNVRRLKTEGNCSGGMKYDMKGTTKSFFKQIHHNKSVNNQISNAVTKSLVFKKGGLNTKIKR